MKTRRTKRSRITRKRYNRRKGGSRINGPRTIQQHLTERQQVSQRIQQYITNTMSVPPGHERLRVVNEMFNYIHDNANIILVGYPRFRQTVRDKIREVYDAMQRNNSVRRNVVGLEEITQKLELLINDIDYNESHP